MKTIYIADFRYGRANLTKAKLVKETPKRFFVEGADDIIGHLYIPYSTRLPKGKYGFFFSGQEALAYLVGQAEKYVELQKKNLDNAIQERDRLRQIAEGGTEHE